MDTREAYRECERVTREAAANFYYGIRLLPAPKRRAMCAVYAYARRVDDVADGSLPRDEKLAALRDIRASLADPVPEDPRLIALQDTRRSFPIPDDALPDLLAGVEMDVAGTQFERFDDLVVYCRRVAGSIGRLCLGIFGSRDMAAAEPLADDLGVAMQLTNILRDLREDRERGRLYLPLEDLRAYGCDEDLLAAPADGCAALIAFEAARARTWFERGLRLRPLLDARSSACVSAMTGIYRRILAQIECDPHQVLRQRVSLPAWEKAWVAARSLAGVGA